MKRRSYFFPVWYGVLMFTAGIFWSLFVEWWVG